MGGQGQHRPQLDGELLCIDRILGVTAVIAEETPDIGVKEHSGPREVAEVLTYQLA